MTDLIKICGLSTPETLAVALDAGADLVGFVRFPRSPRHLDLEEGRRLSAQARGRALRAALFVDPDDAELDAVLAALDQPLGHLRIGSHVGQAPADLVAHSAAVALEWRLMSPSALRLVSTMTPTPVFERIQSSRPARSRRLIGPCR